MYFLRKFLLNELYSDKYYPYLIEGTKKWKESLVISQNPADDGAVPLYRSTDRDGAEFTQFLDVNRIWNTITENGNMYSQRK